jgi:5-methylcytosine-specific restriction protein B
VVPVGADWTDNRNVVGFVNHLRPNPQQKNRPIFNATPVLDLILRADADNTRPYFLILDEMNLSHVERYFADLLSAMESGKGIVLHSEAEPLETGAGTAVPPTIAFPDNLFVIGTVNVDETTYMFSPKVLDRANVIEFRVTATDIEGFLKSGGKPILSIEMAPTGYAEGFLDLARRVKDPLKHELKLAKPETELPAGIFEKLDQCRKVLADLFAILQGSRQEFAYRTIKDIINYAHVDYELTENSLEWDWKRCMDVQSLQKILPKLHGSKKRVSSVLVALATYCEALDVTGKLIPKRSIQNCTKPPRSTETKRPS